MKTNLSAISIHHPMNMTVLCSSSSEENNKLIYNLIFGSNFQGEQWKRVCCNVELATCTIYMACIGLMSHYIAYRQFKPLMLL